MANGDEQQKPLTDVGNANAIQPVTKVAQLKGFLKGIIFSTDICYESHIWNPNSDCPSKTDHRGVLISESASRDDTRSRNLELKFLLMGIYHRMWRA
jgi:hypothetical protein